LKKADNTETCIDGNKLQDILDRIGVESNSVVVPPVDTTSSSTIVSSTETSATSTDSSASSTDTSATSTDSSASSTEEVIPTAPVTPNAPSITNDDTLNTVNGMSIGMEYNLDNTGYIAYGDGSIFSVIDFSGDHTLLVRVASEGINPAGDITTLTFTTNL
jgi:hypothetical protein